MLESCRVFCAGRPLAAIGTLFACHVDEGAPHQPALPRAPAMIHTHLVDFTLHCMRPTCRTPNFKVPTERSAVSQ